MHFPMSVIHQHVSPVRQKINPSLFSSVPKSLKTGTTELIQIYVRYDVISEMWAGFKPTALSETLLSETMPDVFWT